jgi:hypothetical protein
VWVFCFCLSTAAAVPMGDELLLVGWYTNTHK